MSGVGTHGTGDSPDGLLDGLAEAARDHPHVAAVLLPSGPRRGAAGFRALTFGQLARRSDALAAGLAAQGASEGARVGMLLPPGEAFFVAAFALLKAGAVPVLVDPGIGVGKLARALAEADPAWFLGAAKAHAARALLRWVPRARALTVRRAEAAGRRLGPYTPTPRPPGETAAILYTSGSTGPPKGVAYRLPHFAAQVRALRSLYDLRLGGVSLATFPPFALFGPALGLTTVVPRMDPGRPARVDPLDVLAAARGFDATVMFGSPALLRTVGRHAAAHGSRAPSLRTVVSAGAPVAEEVIRDVLGMLGPGGRVVTPYGATEALPITSIGSEELLALEPRPRRGVCVGRPGPEAEVTIVAMDDTSSGGADATDPAALPALGAPLPDGEIGEIVVRGPMVTERYVARPEATALAKRDWGGRTAHRTGDLGWVDHDGRLWFCGRVAHLLHTADGPVPPLPSEEVFAAHPSVARVALVGLGDRGVQRPVLCVELEPDATWTPALAAELRATGAAHPHTAGIGVLLHHPGLPVDIRHNAKVDYDALRRWAAAHT